MKNILVSNFQDSGENVMIFTEHDTPATVEKKLNSGGHHYDDIVEVPTEDVGFYVYEACHLREPIK